VSRIAYVNGQYLPQDQAMVPIEDRGYQFSDGVYEVCEVFGGALIDEAHHMARLDRSLSELRISAPLAVKALSIVMQEVMRRNRLTDGFLYLQVTRGVAPRDHGFPQKPVRPSLVITAKSVDPAKGEKLASNGVAVATTADIRWKRVDIKTVSLLPNVLAKQEAREKGCFEAWLVDDAGFVTEGASSNAWIITAEGRIVTRPAQEGILRGVTRTTLLTLIAELQLPFEERAFSLAEAYAAKEAFVTAATTLVMPVVSIDGHLIGNGQPGPVVQRLRSLFHESAEKTKSRLALKTGNSPNL
jgi:D-alanine transaminase